MYSVYSIYKFYDIHFEIMFYIQLDDDDEIRNTKYIYIMDNRIYILYTYMFLE